MGVCAFGWEGAEWAGALRDRLLAAVYVRLFTWLINAVNMAIEVLPHYYPVYLFTETFIKTGADIGLWFFYKNIYFLI